MNDNDSQRIYRIPEKIKLVWHQSAQRQSYMEMIAQVLTEAGHYGFSASCITDEELERALDIRLKKDAAAWIERALGPSGRSQDRHPHEANKITLCTQSHC